jgi:hypothetical protein
MSVELDFSIFAGMEPGDIDVIVGINAARDTVSTSNGSVSGDKILTDLLAAFVERADDWNAEDVDDHDTVSELARQSVSPYTSQIVYAFAVVGEAWHADLEEMGGGDSITDMMALALQLTYEGAFGALLDHVKENTFVFAPHMDDSGEWCEYSETRASASSSFCPNDCAASDVASYADTF